MDSCSENMEEFEQKSGKRVYTKRTTDKIRRWTKEESKLYEDFIDTYSDIFNDPSSKRVTKIFIFMANYIGSKTPSQCRSHHQKFFRRIQREKLLSSGKVANEEELEKLLPKKRKKKTEKAIKEGGFKDNNLEMLLKKEEETKEEIEKQGPEQGVIKLQETNEELEEGQRGDNMIMMNNMNMDLNNNMNNMLNMNNIMVNNNNNGFYQQEDGNNDPQQGPPLNFIENEGYGKTMDHSSQFMSLKNKYEAFHKLSRNFFKNIEFLTIFILIFN